MQVILPPNTMIFEIDQSDNLTSSGQEMSDQNMTLLPQGPNQPSDVISIIMSGIVLNGGYNHLWAPCIILLILISIHLLLSMTSRGSLKISQSGSKMLQLKVSIPIVLALMSLAQGAYNKDNHFVLNFHQGARLANVIQAGIFGMMASLAIEERRRNGSPRLSRPITAILCLILMSDVISLSSYPLTDMIRSMDFEAGFLIDVTRFLGILLALVLSWFPARDQRDSFVSKDAHPEERAPWWSDLTLNWTVPLLRTGWQRNLIETDIPELASVDRCINVLPKLDRAWRQEEFRCRLANEGEDHHVDNKQSGKSILEQSEDKATELNLEGMRETGSLFTALRQAYGVKYLSLQLIKTVFELQDIVMTLLTAALMNHIQNRENESSWYGISILVSMFLFKCSTEIGHHRIWFSINRLSRHMKISTMMIIFKKSMTLKNECMKDKTNGELVNLISDDCDRVFGSSNILFIALMTPLKISIALILLYSYLGSSMMVGVILMVLLIPLNSFVGKRLEKLNKQTNDSKDRRVKLMNEIINGIKVLKLYAWEKSFIDKVNAIRSEEVDSRVKNSILHACIDSMFRAIPFLVKSSAFGTFLLLGGHLDATTAFAAISLFHTLNHPLSLMALIMPGYTEAVESLKRINKFLNGENISTDIIKKTTRGRSAISVKDGEFTWERSSPKSTLANINVDIPKGGLVAVVGSVGSGKSSLLSAMLGEMEKLRGDVEAQGRMAYVPQEAWIQNASLQENVLFGSKFDQQHYRQVVHNCCLKNDINILSAGDKTEIGEKGINLSGGQKQRVSLARAVYKEADVYLLDDPLSAVDAHVGKNIFDRVIGPRGMLKEKTRVLVTHGIQWLPFVDSIIVMKDGRVSEAGTYQELISKDGTFAQFLSDLCSHPSTEEGTEVTKLKQNIFKRLNSKQNGDSERIDLTENVNKLTVHEDSSENSSSDDEDDFSCDADNTNSNGKLIDEEELEQGAVKKDIYIDYLKAIGVKSSIFFALIYFVTIVADNCNNFSVKAWTDDPLLSNTSLTETTEYFDRSLHHFYVFVISGFIEVVTAFLFVMLTLKGGFLAANRIHNNLLHTILRCPMSFFDTTPSCRVVNRFSTDIVRVDTLGHYLRGCIERVFSLSTCIILIIFNAPIILLCLLPVIGFYYFLQQIHVSSYRQINRFKSKRKSPMFVHFSETLNGISSIRAYNCQNRFIQTMENRIEEWVKIDTMELAVGLWYGMRATFLYLFIQMIAGLIAVLDTSMTAGMAGLVLTFAGQFCGNLSSLIHIASNLQTELVSLERVFEYSKKPTEAPWEISETKPEADWPSNGHVVLNDVKARYRDGLDLVLKGVDCDIKHGEKIGIVGRTGAGKSSLTVALFRLVEAASGHIDIDNEKTSNLGLHDLRSKITILPQDPVIFGGTLRMNLDPFDKCSTEELWVALQHSHLKSFVESLPDQLDFQCGEGGKNLSVGQRQLLCLARTLLRQTNILVLDEATAAVDMETDELIQKTIRTEFKECTVLTIAHRLNTIMDYDRILVLDQGVVKEFDSPNNLLADKDSTFYSMAKDAKLVQ